MAKYSQSPGDSGAKLGVGTVEAVPEAIPSMHSARDGTNPETPTPDVLRMPEQEVIEPKIPEPQVVEAVTVKTEQDKHKIEIWRWLKSRVRRCGGLVRDLGPMETELAKKYLAELGRTAEQGWDPDVFITGYDNAAHSIMQQHIFGKKGEVPKDVKGEIEVVHG